MDEEVVRVRVENKFKLDGLEFMHDDGERIVFSSPEDDIVVYYNGDVYNYEGMLGNISKEGNWS